MRGNVSFVEGDGRKWGGDVVVGECVFIRFLILSIDFYSFKVGSLRHQVNLFELAVCPSSLRVSFRLTFKVHVPLNLTPHTANDAGLHPKLARKSRWISSRKDQIGKYISDLSVEQ